MKLDICWTELGCVFNNKIYTLTLLLNYGSFNISYLEMINIIVAIKVWGPKN